MATRFANLGNHELHIARVDYYQRLMSAQQLGRGMWAVAITGQRQWGRDSAIGDGITSATMSLVTRCETREEADRMVEELTDLQPGLLPGSGSAWVFSAVKYCRTDYIGQQNIDRSQTRNCDRRIANL